MSGHSAPLAATTAAPTPTRPDAVRGLAADTDLRDRHPRWMQNVALSTIALSLILLVVVPELMQQRSAGIRGRIEAVTAPAEHAARDLSHSLTRQIAALRGFALEQDSSFLAEYYLLREMEGEYAREYGRLAPRLPAQVGRDYAAARGLVDRWHAMVEAQVAGNDLRAEAQPGLDLAVGRPLHEAALAALTRLRSTLAGIRSAETRQIEEAERYSLATTVGLALLALVSLGMLLWLGVRVRAAAAQAEQGEQEALRANEARARMLRGVTHDLKNPLSVAANYIDMLQMGMKGEVPAEQLRLLDRARAALGNVNELINDLVQVSHAEAGLLQFEQTPIQLDSLAREVVEDHARQAAAAGLALRFEQARDIPPVLADATRTRQVLSNLLGNALKYTPAGGMVSVEVRAANPSAAARTHVTVAVSDTGPGIPAHELENVFQEFVRLPSTSSQDGSGIGLAISRHFARGMHGDIEVRSEVGRGSTFTFWLPSVEARDEAGTGTTQAG